MPTQISSTFSATETMKNAFISGKREFTLLIRITSLYCTLARRCDTDMKRMQLFCGLAGFSFGYSSFSRSAFSRSYMISSLVPSATI